MTKNTDFLNHALLIGVKEIEAQISVQSEFPDGVLSVNETFENLYEWIEHNEYGITFDLILCLLDEFPFVIKSSVAILIVKISLIMNYKISNIDGKYECLTRN